MAQLGEAARTLSDDLVVEEPLELRVAKRPWMVTMRTPGDDADLVFGLLYAEGVIFSSEEVSATRFERVEHGSRCDIALGEEALDRWARGRLRREMTMLAACGVCGKPGIEDLGIERPRPLLPSAQERSAALSAELVRTLPEQLRSAQRVFERTGGLHAAGLFSHTGELEVVREDVGRHNALDKVVGAVVRDHRSLGDDERPLVGRILVTSGRAGFELVHKAVCAGADALVAVGAASSLAVDLAAKLGLGLFWFVREDGSGRQLAPGGVDGDER